MLDELGTKIQNLQHDDIVKCMESYDKLSEYATGLYQNVTDSNIKTILSRIMTSKRGLTVDLNTLRTKTFDEKKGCLKDLLLNSTSIQESDYLWTFFERQDINDETKMNSLGIQGDLYKQWKNKNKMRTTIREVDNFFAKCICRLDYFLKNFIFGKTILETTRHNDVSRSPISMLLHQMKLLQ